MQPHEFSLRISRGEVVDGSADPCDDLKSSSLIGGRIGYEYGDRKLPPIRQGNQPDVIGGCRNAVVNA